MLDNDIAEKMKDEYPGLVSQQEPPSINIEKASTTDLSSAQSDHTDNDTEIEHTDEGETAHCAYDKSELYDLSVDMIIPQISSTIKCKINFVLTCFIVLAGTGL